MSCNLAVHQTLYVRGNFLPAPGNVKIHCTVHWFTLLIFILVNVIETCYFVYSLIVQVYSINVYFGEYYKMENFVQVKSFLIFY